MGKKLMSLCLVCGLAALTHIACSRIESRHPVRKDVVAAEDGGINRREWDSVCQTLGKPEECDLCDELRWYDDGSCDEFCLTRDPDCPTDPALVGRWRMDDGEGQIVRDSSIYGNDGRLVDGATRVQGRIGLGVSLDGGEGHIVVKSNATLNLGDAGTMALWVFVRSLPPTMGALLIEKFTHAPTGYQFGLFDRAGERSASIWIGGLPESFRVDASPSLFNYQQWTHLAVTWRDSNVKFYKDGKQFGPERQHKTPAGDNGLDLLMGYDRGTKARFDGILDEVHLFNRALHPREIERLAK